ncbi:protein CASC3-like isoform X2 [Sitodiplosis mosellana]|uniref:protein CASC3-like isoform X2 n=1 Tax=Sitodiplosis mosellana TaxID=263140 RepID=UPI0024442CCF|nr:protein CASC3-like isoform X2 [Sitodiplosis mosellana]
MSTVQPSQPQPQSPDTTKKVCSDGEDFSDTANETGTFELCSDANKTATSSSHQDSEYDTASDSQSSDEADPLHKAEPVGDSGGGDNANDGLIDLVSAKTGNMQITDDIPIEESRKLSRKENDLNDDADGEADDDEESSNRIGRRGSRSGDSEDDDDDDDDDRSDDDIRSDDESESDNGSIILDLERQRGDGEEEQNEDSKKVDDDEDRSNPQYIPKRGVFYEHDDRTADDPDANSAEQENGDEEQPPTPVQKKTTKKTTDRWTHDFYDESEQAPKSRAELVNSYGYDIRNEDGPPKTRRNRRYNRGPSKYTRKWEDEMAYAKQNSAPPPRNPRPEDFPELGSKGERRRPSHHEREEKENKTRQNYQIDDRNDDNRNYSSRKRTSMRQISDRRDSDRRDSDRRDSDRRDSDRRDNSRSRHQNDRYPSSRGNRNDDRSDDRRRNMDKGFNKGRGRSTMEFKNQNRNKNHEYEGRGGGGGGSVHNRNNSSGHSESRNQQHHHHHDDEHVESVSFTNSKLNNNSNRFSNVEYSNVGSMQGREYGIQEPTMQQQTQNQQSQSQQRFQLVSNEIPHNLESGNQMSNQQNSQSTLLTTNHSLPISSSVIATPGAAPLNQQALHGQAINQVQQQQPMGHIQGAGHVKRYSNQRQRTGLEAQTQPPQAQTQQLPMNVVIQQQPQQPSQPPQNPHQTSAHQTPQPNVVPNVSAPTQFQPNYFPNEYPAINQLYVSDIRQPPSGPAAGYLPQGAPPPTVAAPVGVPQMMNFVSAHAPMQPAPVVQPVVPNAQVVAQPPQGQYPAYPPYAGVQNYNSASGITYYAPQTQPPPRPILSQRRHKNAIPIMAPPERSNKNAHGSRSGGHGSGHNPGSNDSNNNSDQQQAAAQQSMDNSAENIDHILDNMFVQRPHPYQSGLAESPAVARKDSTPPVDGQNVSGNSYSQEQNVHDSAPTSSLLQGKDDTGNPDQSAASFGDMNISVAIQANQ